MTYLLLSCIVFILVAYFSPKNLTKPELYAVSMFSIILGFVIDIILDLKLNVYGYFEPGVQFAGFLPILILFPTSGVLYINFYPFEKSRKAKLFYILFWTVFSLAYEFFAIVSGFFYHNGWTYTYSALTYPFLLVLQLVHFHFFKHLVNKE